MAHEIKTRTDSIVRIFYGDAVAKLVLLRRWGSFDAFSEWREYWYRPGSNVIRWGVKVYDADNTKMTDDEWMQWQHECAAEERGEI